MHGMKATINIDGEATEVSLPHYRKDNTDLLFCFYKILETGVSVCVLIDEVSICDKDFDYECTTECTAQEFEEAFDKTVNELTKLAKN